MYGGLSAILGVFSTLWISSEANYKAAYKSRYSVKYSHKVCFRTGMAVTYMIFGVGLFML